MGALGMQIYHTMIFMDGTKVMDLLQRDILVSFVVVFHVGASKVVVVADNLHVNRIDTVSPANCVVKESDLPVERSGIRFANLTQLRLDNSKGIGYTLLIGWHKDIVKDGKRRRLMNIVIIERR